MKFTPFLFVCTFSAVAAGGNLRRRLCSSQESPCDLNGSIGVKVCAFGRFDACVSEETLRPFYKCGQCVPAEPVRVPVLQALSSSPICTTDNVADVACKLRDGTSGAKVCHKAFYACRDAAKAIAAGDKCGPC